MPENREGLQGSSGESASYWQTDEGRLNQAIRDGLREAGVEGPLAHLVGPILRAVMRDPESGRSYARASWERLARDRQMQCQTFMREVERLSAWLALIDQASPTDLALDPQWAQRMARSALRGENL